MRHEFLESFKSREEILEELIKKRKCEILVVGGGIHGAQFARLASLNEFDTVLLERADYGGATSSRSSKMAHGGLRYLEHLDLWQVLQGIKAREDLFITAPHFVKPYPFLIPVRKGSRLFGLKLKAGLFIYDLFNRDKLRKHKWLPASDSANAVFADNSMELRGSLQFYDGIMNDVRLVHDYILSARQEGALCLNYCGIEKIKPLKSGRIHVYFRDSISGSAGHIETGSVVNCAGPWVGDVAEMGGVTWIKERVRYSQGIHLLFDVKWEHSALLLPLEKKGRYYFVWPHFAGTLVGTTEREIVSLEDDPMPIKEEIELLLSRLDKDLPSAGLNRDTVHYCFAGVRVLPVLSNRDRSAPTDALSRKHKWVFDAGILTLLGGKFTTASWTVREGLKKLCKLARIKDPIVSTKGRLLPGAASFKKTADDFIENITGIGIDREVAEGAVLRFGSRVRYLYGDEADEERSLTVLSNRLFLGELDMAIDIEQAEFLEDIMRRRLCFEYMSDHGFELLPDILSVLAEKKPGLDIGKEEKLYRERISAIKALLGKV
ncbi:MAG: FAD-dependent oxidoreductase [Candidatus Dadabacteria bacterium]|nr:MAG: FAD-dependent oxidoreductase [Candidatus Dadabacteria bacterium]